MRPQHVPLLRVKVNLGVIAIKGYSTLFKGPKSVAHH